MLPKQVKSQIADANAHFEKVTPVVDPATPVSEDPAPPTPPVVEVTPPEPPAPPVETVSKKEHDRVLQQLRSLQGIHRSIDADRAALRAQVATLSETTRMLSEQVEQFKAVAKPPQPLTSEQLNGADPEFVDMVVARAKDMMAPQLASLNATIAKLTTRNAELEQMVTGVASRTEHVSAKTFLDEIRDLMPDFATVNDDPRFMDWLQQMNPLTGRPYSIDFYEARDTNNAARVVEHFRMYAALQTPPAPPAPTPPAAPPLAQLVAPAPGAPSSPPPAKNTRVWTSREISEFYKDKAAGRYANNPARAAELEADIFKAQSENRIAA